MRFLSKFFHRWYLYILPIILLPVVATLYGQQTLSVYESSALLYINKPSAVNAGTTAFDQYLTPAQNGANAMNEALLSETFAVRVAQATDLAKKYDLSSQQGQDDATTRLRSEVLIVASGVGENTVTVTVDDKSPTLAQQIAVSLIQQFTTYFAQGQLDLDQKQIAFYQQQLSAAQSLVQRDQIRVSEYLQAHPNDLASTAQVDPQLEGLQQQLSSDQDQVNKFNVQLSSVQFDLAAAQSGVTDIFIQKDAPRLPLKSTLHLKKLIVFPLGGLGAALALIALIVGVQTMTDHRVYSKDDLRAITENMELDIPTIEAVPVLRGLGKHQGPDDDQTDSGISGVLVPVLTVLPQLSAGEITHELRRAVGVLVEDDE